MANNLKTSPQGIDITLQQAQTDLYVDLLSVWGFDESKFQGYGRVYKNERLKKIIPEHYTGKGEYSGTLISTDISKFFFTKASASNKNDEFGDEYKTQINVYFILNLNELKGSVQHRADQEAQIDALNALKDTGLFDIQRIVDHDFREVLREFSGLYDEREWEDMQPHHIFKVECDLIYSLTSNKC